MRHTTLVIMAAGIGARFGGGIKQLQKIGPNGEIIMDYSIHDAIAAGFDKVIFIIRKDIEQEFREAIGNRIEAQCERMGIQVKYAFQSLQDIPEGSVVPEGRTKPWGTGQAVLAAKDYIEEPFAVINADDYYGKQAFVLVHDYLVKQAVDGSSDAIGKPVSDKAYDSLGNMTTEYAPALCMAGYHLKNTLSEYGSVTRGVCHVDEEEYLISIEETKEIQKTDAGITSSNGSLEENTCVSMNMFGLSKEFLELLEEGFVHFFHTPAEDDLKKEFLIPVFIGRMLKERKVSVKVLETKDRWFGITYQEDVGGVKNAFDELYKQGIYQNELYSDLISDIR